ncbi:hypothetical protein P280DRAFT_497828 [Massarina eburnea CBS 473.64]|uniref:Pathway-specific nitrogen regulator n=1 Tax=Massarina eburnea CBS 473.64 TaxID=1395130 RepID=A0A6A6S739_9PLEO|nr:hypothetical protein P280DRAFT_497828 [Massarina eburnea CBS 473.64]
MATVRHEPPPGATPFAIYEDPEDQGGPPSPSVYEGDVSFNSETSLPSIATEHEHDAQPVLQRHSVAYTSRPSSRPSALSNSRSRRNSDVTSTSFVSSLPSEMSVGSKPIPPANNLDSRYSPRKQRSPFRNPDSVRAMRMTSPLPVPHAERSRERLKGNYKIPSSSRSARSDSMSTTGSRRRRSHRESAYLEQAHENPQPTPSPQQFPLVLLHVTILPMQMPYPHDMMAKVMPEWLVENYRVLEEKLQDIILMRRGLLIPHPRDEYEVLEERILESLELKIPRLLKCGHFIATYDDDDDDDHDETLNEDVVTSVAEEGAGRGSRMSGGTITVEEEADHASVCMECRRQVKKKGVGAGTKKWDIKIYAANGLMRAGAWLAAWSEMERCDVEITPWIPEDVRKALDKRVMEEQEAVQRKRMYAAELQRQIQEEAARQQLAEEEADAKRRAEEAQLQSKIEAEAAALQRKLEEKAAEKRRLEETFHEQIKEAKEAMRLEFEAQALAEANLVTERLRAMEDMLKKEQENRSRNMPLSISHQPHAAEIPLGTLLKNYVLLLIQGSSNILLVGLTGLVVYLAMNIDHQPLPVLSAGPVADHRLTNAVSSVVITSTATMTATSVATLTITETPSAESIFESAETTAPSVDISSDVPVSFASESTSLVSAPFEIPSETSEALPFSTTVRDP